MKNILAIIGSASQSSANTLLINELIKITKGELQFTIFDTLKTLPHFDPELSASNPPKAIVALRTQIAQADGIIISTPEYVFSIPSGLKNMIEWCVATTLFSDKPTGLITASAHGQKGHEELQLIMHTVMARFTEETTLLINGVKGKVNTTGIIDPQTSKNLQAFAQAFIALVKKDVEH